MSNCCRWSRDNAGLAVGGDDKVLRLYKVTSKDFKGEMPLACELKDGGHTEAINTIDISPGKSLVVSAGNDCTGCIFDLATKKCIKKLTFRDKTCTDIRGNPDNTNFLIRGCFFSNCGRFVYLLAAKMRYKSFLVRYEVQKIGGNQVDFRPISTLEVHQ
jgi:WD40 repeat protein